LGPRLDRPGHGASHRRKYRAGKRVKRLLVLVALFSRGVPWRHSSPIPHPAPPPPAPLPSGPILAKAPDFSAWRIEYSHASQGTGPHGSASSNAGASPTSPHLPKTHTMPHTKPHRHAVAVCPNSFAALARRFCPVPASKKFSLSSCGEEG
jgi:hypothetical protein